MILLEWRQIFSSIFSGFHISCLNTLSKTKKHAGQQFKARIYRIIDLFLMNQYNYWSRQWKCLLWTPWDDACEWIYLVHAWLDIPKNKCSFAVAPLFVQSTGKFIIYHGVTINLFSLTYFEELRLNLFIL